MHTRDLGGYGTSCEAFGWSNTAQRAHYPTHDKSDFSRRPTRSPLFRPLEIDIRVYIIIIKTLSRHYQNPNVDCLISLSSI
jgi:hypothetical protein